MKKLTYKAGGGVTIACLLLFLILLPSPASAQPTDNLSQFAATTSPQITICPAGGVLFVDQSNTAATHDGNSWATAFIYLQDALKVADPCDIHVAEGTYYPDEGTGQIDNDRDSSFELKDEVALYGGFPTGGSSTRDWMAHPTILSGDIDGDNDPALNANKVVYAYNTDGTTLLDGFRVEGGNADIDGAGIYALNSSAKFRNLIITGNYATRDGGGLYAYQSSSTLTNVSFIGNAAGDDGGGMYSRNGTLVPGIKVINAAFSGNVAEDGGGGMFNSTNTKPTLTNVTFSGNYAYANNGTGVGGGGMYNSSSADTNLTNVIFWNNGDGFGTGSGASSATASLYNVAGAAVNYSHSLIEGQNLSGAGNNFDGTDVANNPLFVMAPTLATAGSPTVDGDMRLKPTSPVIDKGDSTTIGELTDLAGSARISKETVDIGAYETLFCPAGDVLYVDKAVVAGSRDGSSWANSIKHLQTALQVADACEIRVARGTYYPDEGAGQINNLRSSTFQLKSGVAVYGGYPTGGGTTADWEANATILSGDIDGDGNLANNAYTVVNGSSTAASAVLDGFTVQAGYADNSSTSRQKNGAGFFNDGGSPTLVNLKIQNNKATGDGNKGDGGGMYNTESSPTLTNVTFSGNSTDDKGAGMYNIYSNPVLSNVTFSGNIAEDDGAGMYNSDSHPMLTDVTFISNATTDGGDGGGMANIGSGPTLINVTFSGNSADDDGGGMYNRRSNSNPTMTNVIFNGNISGDLGGGMFNSYGVKPTLTNVTFSGNFAADSGGGMFNREDTEVALTNVIIWGNQAITGTASLHNEVINQPSTIITISHSLVQGLNPAGIGNLPGSSDPQFVQNPTIASAGNPTTDGDLRLRTTSPAINVGLNSANQETTDLDGHLRKNGVIDLGAFERQSAIVTGSPLSLSEGGVNGSYTIKLSSAPDVDVMVMLAASTGECTVFPTTDTLTASNWASGITITVSPVDDAVLDGDKSCDIINGFTDSTQSAFDNLLVPGVVVVVSDNEVPTQIAIRTQQSAASMHSTSVIGILLLLMAVSVWLWPSSARR